MTVIFSSPYEYRQSTPSPYCGRIDDHEPHPWTTPRHRAAGGEPYQCPGPPLIAPRRKDPK